MNLTYLCYGGVNIDVPVPVIHIYMTNYLYFRYMGQQGQYIYRMELPKGGGYQFNSYVGMF